MSCKASKLKACNTAVTMTYYSLETGARDLRTSRALSLAIFFSSPIPFCISSSLVLRSLLLSPAMIDGALFSLKYPVWPTSLYNKSRTTWHRWQRWTRTCPCTPCWAPWSCPSPQAPGSSSRPSSALWLTLALVWLFLSSEESPPRLRPDVLFFNRYFTTQW